MESQRAATAEAILLNHRKLLRQKCVRKKKQQQIDAASGRYQQTDGIDASEILDNLVDFDNLANLENLENFEAL